MSKFTKGPWFDMGLEGHPQGADGELRRIGFRHGTAMEGNRSSGHVAEVGVLNNNEEAREIARANAKLIAAAPDLYHIANVLCLWADRRASAGKANLTQGQTNDLVELARKALAKAEGK